MGARSDEIASVGRLLTERWLDRLSDAGRSRRCGTCWGRRRQGSREGTRERLGGDRAASAMGIWRQRRRYRNGGAIWSNVHHGCGGTGSADPEPTFTSGTVRGHRTSAL